ncbi:hypothetical protein WMZ97_09990 [Lentibacillus sp. N15]
MQTIEETEYNAKRGAFKKGFTIDVVAGSTGLDKEVVAQNLQEMTI